MKSFLHTVVLTTLLAAGTAHAAEPLGSIPVKQTTREDVAAAIEAQKVRRGFGIAGTVLGGVAIIAGLVLEVDDAVDNSFDDNADNDGDSNNATTIGLAIGLPLIAIGVYNIVDATGDIRTLRRQRVALKLNADEDKQGLKLAYRF